MPGTGYDFENDWSVHQNAVVLTQGGTVEDVQNDPIPMDGKAGIQIGVKAVYSNHAKATGGLWVYIERDCGDAYEDDADGPQNFEMPFTQNGTHRRALLLGPSTGYKIHLVWANTTSGSSVTVTTYFKPATVPPAS